MTVLRRHQLTIEHDCSACGYEGPLDGPRYEYHLGGLGDRVESMSWSCPVCGYAKTGPTLALQKGVAKAYRR